jgi:cytochrome b6-f complex iron-sulfur subunit
MAQALAGPAGINRREFLYYIWGASMALILGGTGGATLWFLYPRFREGEFGGKFRVALESLPAPTDPPLENAAGRFWLVNTGAGILAIYKVCTHLGCLYKWVPLNNRFECPCHGSKYQKDGTYIEGPAPRSLDRFVVEAVGSGGSVIDTTPVGDRNKDPNAGAPVAVDNASEVLVDTGTRILGPLHN